MEMSSGPYENKMGPIFNELKRYDPRSFTSFSSKGVDVEKEQT